MQPDTLPPLTDRQARVLRAIASHLELHGYPPSVRYLVEDPTVGLSSPSSVVWQLNRLAELGYIRRDAGVPRGLVLVAPPKAEEVPSGA